MHSLNYPELRSWLVEKASQNGNYRHLCLVEDTGRRQEAIDVLKRIVNDAHADAKRHLFRLTATNLDPLGATSSDSVAHAYPGSLHLTTRKAYFGEIMAGIVAENFVRTPPGQWRVPAFLFRHHELAFDQLERARTSGQPPDHVFGQTGDDCLAFSTGPEGFVTASLVGEAKCTNDHDASMLGAAHCKVNSVEPRPLSLSRVIRILSDQSGDSEAADWANMLRELYYRKNLRDYKRADLVSYTCGRSPVRRDSWARTDAPDPVYSAGRELECVEIHLSNVDGLVDEIYA
jgi:hypothetical protein